jgi:hypothetical protein
MIFLFLLGEPVNAGTSSILIGAGIVVAVMFSEHLMVKGCEELKEQFLVCLSR